MYRKRERTDGRTDGWTDGTEGKESTESFRASSSRCLPLVSASHLPCRHSRSAHATQSLTVRAFDKLCCPVECRLRRTVPTCQIASSLPAADAKTAEDLSGCSVPWRINLLCLWAISFQFTIILRLPGSAPAKHRFTSVQEAADRFIKIFSASWMLFFFLSCY